MALYQPASPEDYKVDHVGRGQKILCWPLPANGIAPFYCADNPGNPPAVVVLVYGERSVRMKVKVGTGPHHILDRARVTGDALVTVVVGGGNAIDGYLTTSDGIAPIRIIRLRHGQIRNWVPPSSDDPMLVVMYQDERGLKGGPVLIYRSYALDDCRELPGTLDNSRYQIDYLTTKSSDLTSLVQAQPPLVPASSSLPVIDVTGDSDVPFETDEDYCDICTHKREILLTGFACYHMICNICLDAYDQISGENFRCPSCRAAPKKKTRWE
jgi:hypothetical protein